jgi:hypothetical protein
MLRFLRAGQAVALSAGGFSWETPSTSEAKDAPTDYFIIDGRWDLVCMQNSASAECTPETGLRRVAIALIGRAAVGKAHLLRTIRPDTRFARDLSAPGGNLPCNAVSKWVVIPEGKAAVAEPHH